MKRLKQHLLLIVLPIISLVSLAIISYLATIQIDRLKLQTDKIYFGNLTQVLYLQTVSSNFKNNILLYSLRSKDTTTIKEKKRKIIINWQKYIKSYKTKDEKEVINDIDKHIIESLKTNKISIMYSVINKIEFLIDYEISNAKNGRKEFLSQYNSMKSTLKIFIISLAILTLAITGFIAYKLFQKHTVLEHSNMKFKRDAITDGMTTLYNKAYFNTILDEKARQFAKMNNVEVAFVMMDIDFFKQYNDTYGHDKGDITLIAVADVLKNYFNKMFEYPFRLGGEEFGVLIFDVNKETLEMFLEDIRHEIMALNIEHSGSKVHDVVTISGGATIITPNDRRTPKEIYIAADKMLYESKHNGRNRFTIE
jgi:diguanylate cyclase (GGDEF)-like protein